MFSENSFKGISFGKLTPEATSGLGSTRVGDHLGSPGVVDFNFTSKYFVLNYLYQTVLYISVYDHTTVKPLDLV